MKKTLLWIGILGLGIASFWNLSMSSPLRMLAFHQQAPTLQKNYLSWGVQNSFEKGSINVQAAWKMFKKKKDIVVAVVDTGIDPTHEFLKDNIYQFKDFQNFGYDLSKGKNSKAPLDHHGHGTHIASIIKSVFPQVKIIPIKYFDSESTEEQIIADSLRALKKAIELKVDIINYSGGGPGASPQERAIIKLAQQKGILVVAAAGNNGKNLDRTPGAYYPASYGFNNIVSVGGYYIDSQSQAQRVDSSNYGKNKVDIYAPGQSIVGALPNKLSYARLKSLTGSRSVAQVQTQSFKKSGSMTGTSQATAFVSGTAALIKAQYPFLKPHQIREILMSSAFTQNSDLPQYGSLKKGRLNAAEALLLAMLKVRTKLLAHL